MIMSDGIVFNFKECVSGLYYYDMTSTDEHNSAKINATIYPYSLLSTVTEAREFYTCADIEGADIERRYRGLLGWPEKSDFNTYVTNKLLLNCNINVDDINISEDIYGESAPIIQGKIKMKKSTVHSNIKKFIYLFQYQRYTKTYIYAWTFLRKWFNITTQEDNKNQFLLVKPLTSKVTTPFIKELEE